MFLWQLENGKLGDMKKIFAIAVLLMLSMVLHAQNDVTKFLGIPVDGSKSEMINKLKAKGYRSSAYDKEILEGEFNGRDVTIHIATNNDKVCRIMVCDKNNVDEGSIKIRFNNLCHQFENNPRYSPLKEDQTIPDDEDISYEMTVHNKRYQAIYFQKQSSEDSVAYAEKLKAVLLSKYTEGQLANQTEEIQTDIVELLTKQVEQTSKRIVWFIISKFRGEYYISMYYDNEYNRANGEDL